MSYLHHNMKNSHRLLQIPVSLSMCHPQQGVGVCGRWWLMSSWSRKGEKSAAVIINAQKHFCNRG